MQPEDQLIQQRTEKLKALKEHASQINDLKRAEKMIKLWASTFGKKFKVKYAEGFRKISLNF